MPRRNVFTALDDYLARPTDSRIAAELESLSDALITEARQRAAGSDQSAEALAAIEPAVYTPHLEQIILEDAQRARPRSERLMQSAEKSVEGKIADAAFIYQVSEIEQVAINNLIEKIQKDGRASPLGISTAHQLLVERRPGSNHGYIEQAQATTMNENRMKVMSLRQECHTYLSQLAKSIARYAEEIPSTVRQRYQKEGSTEINMEALVARNERGQNLYDLTDLDTAEHSKDLHPKLYAALDKYQAVSGMLKCLDNNPGNPQEGVRQFNQSLKRNEEKLMENPDSAAIKFIKNVLHALTGGLYSKLTRDTFEFWKTQGEVFADRVNDTQAAFK